MNRHYAPHMQRWTRAANDADEWQPPAWFEWTRLCKLSPALRTMHERNAMNQKKPPRTMSDASFVAFAACFADATKRKVMASLIWDLIGEDVVKLIQAAINKGE